MIWFRMFWIRFMVPRLPKGGVDEYRIAFHCLPTDLDLNNHMTNSRYQNFLDMGRFNLMIRTRIWERVRAAGLSTVLGTSTIRFRREIKLWQRFEVSARLIAWDERWLYFEHRIYVNGDTAAVAIAKCAFIGKTGRAPVEKVREILALLGPSPPFSELARAKNALDALLTA